MHAIDREVRRVPAQTAALLGNRLLRRAADAHDRQMSASGVELDIKFPPRTRLASHELSASRTATHAANRRRIAGGRRASSPTETAPFDANSDS